MIKGYPDIFHSMGVEKPLMLWYNGNLNIGRTIAVIGSRDIHPKTIEITKQFQLGSDYNRWIIDYKGENQQNTNTTQVIIKPYLLRNEN